MGILFPMLGRILRIFKQFTNHRLYRRLPARIPVLVHGPGGDSPLSLLITNWSAGGLFIETDKPLPLFSRLQLEFSIGATGESKVKLKGQVVRHFQGEDKGPRGMGIMFIDFTESGLLILRDFLLKESVTDTSKIPAPKSQ